MQNHEHYRELCAEDAAGRLSKEEWADLQQHLRTCHECQTLAASFFRLNIDVLPQIAEMYGTKRSVSPERKQRLLEQAKAEGLSFGSRPPKEVLGPKLFEKRTFLLAAWAISVLVAILGTALISMQILQSHRVGDSPHGSRAVQNTAAIDATSNQRADLGGLNQKLRDAEARLMTLSEELKQRQRELERLQKSSGKPPSRDAEAELRTLRATVAHQRRRLNDLLRLIAAKPSTGVTADKRLHVVDVFPIDEHGQPTSEFAGRVLYIEGQKLQFYAFDLNHYKGADANSAFYLWGQGRNTDENKKTVVILLGKFSLESQRENRWSLVVSDSRALIGLRYVFVTVESSKHPVTPTGKKILITPLHGQPD